MTPAHDESGAAAHGAAPVKSPVPPGKATIHAQRNTPICHRRPAAPAGHDPVLQPGGPVPRGVRAGRRRARPAAGRMSPAGCAGGLPSPAHPVYGRAAAGAPRGAASGADLRQPPAAPGRPGDELELAPAGLVPFVPGQPSLELPAQPRRVAGVTLGLERVLMPAAV